MWMRTSKAKFQRNLKLKDKYYKDKHTNVQRHKREGRHQDYECRHSKACQISCWKNPEERNVLLLSGPWELGFSVRFVSTFVFRCCQRSCIWAILQNWCKVRVRNVLKNCMYANCIISKVHNSSNCEVNSHIVFSESFGIFLPKHNNI